MKRLKPSSYPLRKPTQKIFLKVYRALRAHYGHRNWWPGETPFEVIVGAILTQSTAWKNVEKAITNLKKRKALTVKGLRNLSLKRLAENIRPAGYFNVKAGRLKNVVDFLWKRYRGNLNKMFRSQTNQLREELLQINGVGEETADSILLYAGDKLSFVVDAYTRRVFSRHRLIRGSEKYGVIRNLFTSLLPKSLKLYNDYHAQIVEVGKDFCRKTPRCEICPLRSLL